MSLWNRLDATSSESNSAALNVDFCDVRPGFQAFQILKRLRGPASKFTTGDRNEAAAMWHVFLVGDRTVNDRQRNTASPPASFSLVRAVYRGSHGILRLIRFALLAFLFYEHHSFPLIK